MRLSRTVELHHGETAMSLASRLATANGIASVADFAKDMGLCRLRLSFGDTEHLGLLANLAGADLSLLIKSTEHRSRQKSRVGDHDFESFLTFRSGPRTCVQCLSEDLERGSGPTWSRPWIRSAWMLRQFRTCTIHGVLLADLTDEVDARLRDDVSVVARSSISRQAHRAALAEAVNPSKIESWAQQRLWQQHPGLDYLDTFSLSGAIRLSEMIGGGILFGKRYRVRDKTPRDWFEAAACGYEIVQGGEGAILSHLESYHGHFDSAKQVVGGRDLYGELYIWLLKASSEFDGLRAAMREQIIDRLPVGPGDEFFGSVPRRRWHSVQTASKESGINPQRMRKLVLTAGLVGAETEKLTDHRVIFDAAEAENLIKLVKGSALVREAEKLSGTSRTQWILLVEAGHLKPIMQSESLHPRYLRTDIEAFVRSIAYEKGKGFLHKLVPIEKARMSARCSMKDIINLLLAHKLARVAIDATKHGFASVLVDPFEVKRKVPQRPKAGLSTVHVAKLLATDASAVSHLRNLGYFVDAVSRSDESRAWMHSISEAIAHRFDRRYVSIKKAAAILGQKSSCFFVKKMRAAGVEPALDKAVVGAHFYFRDAIERLAVD